MRIRQKVAMGIKMKVMARTVFPLIVLGLAGGALAQGKNASRQYGPDNAQGLMRQVAANELRAEREDHSLWQYKQVKTEDGKTTVRKVVETDRATLCRVLSISGRPLMGAEAREEDARIKELISNPQKLQAEQQKEEHDAQLEQRLLQMLGDAFYYHRVGQEGSLTKLDFTPNPEFHPQEREAEVFHHMAGSIWVDARQMRIVRIDGHLASDVKFGGGILGHLAEGGTFLIEQRNVGRGRWRLTRLDVHMNGKALFFKTINVEQREQDLDFKPVPMGVTTEQAAQLLNQEVKRSATGDGGSARGVNLSRN
jgi:hypothetical protein